MSENPITCDEVLKFHQGGKIGVRLTKPLKTQRDLSLAYTPGVAKAVTEIADTPDSIYQYTAKSNLVAVVTDGTAILGMGDLGAAASIPVMEGKVVLFKAFGDVDGWPVPLNNCRLNGENKGKTDPKRIIEITAALAPMYAGINLEDIAAPACFEIEDTLDAMLNIPVFHDDQWGTAVITLAGVMNYCLLSKRDISTLRIVINGAGAAGIRIADMCKAAGVKNLIMCDSRGVISCDRKDLNEHKQRHACASGPKSLSEALVDAHVFVGVSVADCVSDDDVRAMADYPAIFAMANPEPEISASVVAEVMGDKPYIMATGRSDYPNQINNVLGFPFLFRGALDVRANTINTEMKVAASQALAELARKEVPDDVKALYPNENLAFGSAYIIPKPFDKRLFVEISFAVAAAAVNSGAAPATDLTALKASLEERNAKR